jgi:nucleoside-diphosphate-sugar epimerase
VSVPSTARRLSSRRSPWTSAAPGAESRRSQRATTAANTRSTTTWNEYHRAVAAALDAPEPDLVHVPTDALMRAVPDRTGMLRDHFRYSTVFDNAKTRRDLGFEQRPSFAEGVRRTVGWLDERDRVHPWDSEGDDRLIGAWPSVAAVQ